ncbi:uncharacterized protein N7483_008785 [Penicillium malachiteum]|uniref:uncharacterized protein n=1 Tax=Penicillium malachiteum TaxID=1324776 RepID=UPI0025491EB0|nr:uncharacterized protein N7483_008785 [Penicillium malachiteum]KAJ5720851.1 hypothetical protein N7483_008785 [Penicillium malachiteum]
MSITNLPTELLSQICGYLEPSEWCALRITCQILHAKSREAFADRFFKSICMLVSQDGLNGLEQFTTNEFIRTHVKELLIVPVLFEGESNMSVARFRDTSHSVQDYGQYQSEVAEHCRLLDSGAFEDTLTRCVAQFENLTMIGLQSLTMAYRVAGRERYFPRCLGLRSLVRRVPCGRSGIQLYIPRRDRVDFARAHSRILSVLFKAIVASNRPLRKIDTCKDFHLGCTAAAFTIPESIQQSLIPLVQELETLHLCQLAESPEDNSLDFMHTILVEAAPSLKSLTYGQWCPNRNMSPYSLTSLVERVNFRRLMELHLCWVEITYNSFEELLRTAQPTLRILSLHHVNLNYKSMPSSESSSAEDLKKTEITKDEMIQAWRCIWNTIRDELSLTCLSLYKLGCYGLEVNVRDGFSRGFTSTIGHTEAWYNGTHTDIPIHEWINNLRARPRMERSKLLPGGKWSGHAPTSLCTMLILPFTGPLIGNDPSTDVQSYVSLVASR